MRARHGAYCGNDERRGGCKAGAFVSVRAQSQRAQAYRRNRESGGHNHAGGDGQGECGAEDDCFKGQSAAYYARSQSIERRARADAYGVRCRARVLRYRN